MKLRLLHETSPEPGAWNMALDEALLNSADGLGIASLRYYTWAQPTLSLGYFQRVEDRATHSSSGECLCVRRSTGGGAIVHDRELTYSLVMPVKDRFAAREAITALYRTIHQTLIDTLRNEWGVESTLFEKGTCSEDICHKDAFLCFKRRSEGDVILGPTKIVGSAQRYLRSAVLLHGSILLDQSPAAPGLPGIAQLGGPLIEANDLANRWTPLLLKNLDASAEVGSITAEEKQLAEEIEQKKFAAASWTNRR